MLDTFAKWILTLWKIKCVHELFVHDLWTYPFLRYNTTTMTHRKKMNANMQPRMTKGVGSPLLFWPVWYMNNSHLFPQYWSGHLYTKKKGKTSTLLQNIMKFTPRWIYSFRILYQMLLIADCLFELELWLIINKPSIDTRHRMRHAPYTHQNWRPLRWDTPRTH